MSFVNTMKIKSYRDLETIKEDYLEREKEFLYTAHICYAAGCISSDCKEVKEAFIHALEVENLQSKVRIKLTGCMGACTLGPTLILNPGKFFTATYLLQIFRLSSKNISKKGSS